MYLTQNDLIKFQIENNNNINTKKVLKEIITEDVDSQFKKDMQLGIEYYSLKHKILEHDFRTYYIDKKALINERKSDNKIINGYHRLLVDQKADYMAGKSISIVTDDEDFSKQINSLLGKKFNNILYTLVVGSSNAGTVYLHPFINQFGKFDYIKIDGSEVIPIYDTQFSKILIGIIRYYQIEIKRTIDGKSILRYKAEVWDSEKTTFYAEDDDGDFILDSDYPINPRPYWYSYNTAFPNQKKAFSWGRVPFIEFPNDDLKMSDLILTKTLIDDYDFQVSDMSNKLIDIAKYVWILKGYQGTDLGEFVKNLESFGAIKVKESGSVDNKVGDLPYEAHDSYLNRLEDNIYIFGRGVNMRSDKFGNSPSGVALRFMYSLLDLKANSTIIKYSLGLQEFAWFFTDFINRENQKKYDPQSVDFIFNKSMILNEKEMADIAVESKGVISDRTILANHPWVKNPAQEEEWLKEEKQNIIF